VKNLFILIFSLFFINTIIRSEVPDNYRYVKTWKLKDRFATVDSVPVDTAHLNFQDRNAVDRFSIANSYNGNLGSPIQSKIYFDRPETNDFLFFNAYYPYIYQIETATFYNTKTPFSSLNYLSGGTLYRKEDQIGFLFTANANKKLNFGTTLDYIYARGEYKQQAVKRFTGSLFGSYSGERYSATGLLSTNNLSNQENGGITDVTYLTNPPALSEAKDFPVRIGAEAQSTYQHSQFFFNQQYSLGFNREIKGKNDSVKTEFVPVTRFAHTIRIDDMRKRYYEKTVEKTFYKNTYLPLVQTNDTAALQKMTNNLSVSLAEEFNKLMRFGLTAYLENEVERFTYAEDTLLFNTLKSNSKAGAILSKEKIHLSFFGRTGFCRLQGR